MIRWHGNPLAHGGQKIMALEIGSSKVCCLVAALDEDEQPKIIGSGFQAAAGMRAGSITHLEDAQRAISDTMNAAEETAGVQAPLQRVIVNLGSGMPQSHIIHCATQINGRAITEHDLERLVGDAPLLTDQYEILATYPLGYALDGQEGISDPIGMSGQELQARQHRLAVLSGTLRTLKTAISRSHLEAEQVIFNAAASGLACLVDDERDLGTLLLDMGGGTTCIGIFHDHQLAFADSVPVGGQHVTSDIARGLATSRQVAERLKILHGHASAGDSHTSIAVPQIGEQDNEPQIISSHELVRIIQPRLEETFEIVRQRLHEARHILPEWRSRVVLTGGASQLPGMRELANRILERPTRIARPQPLAGLPETMAGPAFSCCLGLLRIGIDAMMEARDTGNHAWLGQLWAQAARLWR